MTQTKFWALEQVCERWDGSQTWEDRYIDEYYGLFLSEEDAQKLLEDNKLSRESQKQELREQYDKQVSDWNEKHADDVAAYDKAIADGVPKAMLHDPKSRFMDFPRLDASVDSWHEVTTIPLNNMYAKGN
jgi:hypothetical protein